MDGKRDADLLPRLTDEFNLLVRIVRPRDRVEIERQPSTVLRAHAVGAELPAGFVEQSVRLRDVERRLLNRRHAVGRRQRRRDVLQGPEAVADLLQDRRAVRGQPDRGSHGGIAVPRPLQVEIDVVVDVARLLERRESGRIAQAVQITAGHRVPKVDFVCLDLRFERIAVRDDLKDHLIEFGASAPVERIRDHHDLLRAVPALNFERPDPNRKRVVRDVVDVRVCARRCLGRMHGFAPAVEKNVSTNGEYGFFIW